MTGEKNLKEKLNPFEPNKVPLISSHIAVLKIVVYQITLNLPKKKTCA